MMPRKKDFPAAKTDTLQYDAGNEAGLSLDNATRTVKWHVSENKDACGRARRTLMGKTLFALLRQVTWTRGTGGAIHGSDEYHEDAGRDTPGGGGSYLKDLFGPMGETVHEEVNGWNRTTGNAVRSKMAIRTEIMYLAIAFLLKLTAPKDYYGAEPTRDRAVERRRTGGFWDRWL
ncbi:conserved hypothetical protein [Ricinus communis]|uniref:Uncharacterized protein n=1 Tax=Ricinus communis TaxID=3988 RepID=B9TEU3_RICCO|nr:conserved hypothetical protein [Ricinus communis]